jgi:hypothetical protein
MFQRPHDGKKLPPVDAVYSLCLIQSLTVVGYYSLTSRRFRISVLEIYSLSGRWASELGSTSPLSTRMGLSNRAITTPSHCACIAWSLTTTKLEGQGHTPELRSNSSPTPRRSICRSRSTDVLYVRSMSSPKMNSFVIKATNNRIFSGRRPKSSIRKTFLKMERFSSDNLSSVYRWFCCLSDHQAVKSDQANIMLRCRQSRSMAFHRPSPVWLG